MFLATTFKIVLFIQPRWHKFLADMFVFYNWPFPHVQFAKNAAYIIGLSLLILGSFFSDCMAFYGDLLW